MTTVLVLLVCFSSVVRADGPNDENSVAGMVNAMAKQNEAIATLTAALEAKQMDRKHIQLTTGGEVVELVRAADVKALTEQVEAYDRKIHAQDARLAAQEARITELDAAKATLAAQQAQISELSATVAQLLAIPQTRPTPVDATKTTAPRRLEEAGSPPPSPSAPVCRVLISRQTVVAGESWLRTDAEWSINPHNPSAAQFSILDQLEGMGRNPDGDNKILFELYWPELEGTPKGPRQLWKQSSNPVLGVPGAAVEGYEAVDAPYTGEYWGGLQHNSD
eukprot:scaffold30559_cov69-Phaeocystis_antarctica.AAC.1